MTTSDRSRVTVDTGGVVANEVDCALAFVGATWTPELTQYVKFIGTPRSVTAATVGQASPGAPGLVLLCFLGLGETELP